MPGRLLRGVVALVGEVVVVAAVVGRLREHRLRGAEVHSEPALLDGRLRVVVVARGVAEEVHRVAYRRRRLELHRGEDHVLHPLYEHLLRRTLGIAPDRLLDRLRLDFLELAGVRRIDGAPLLVDVVDHPLAGDLALLAENHLALLLDGVAEVEGLFVVGVVLEHYFALEERVCKFVRRQELPRPAQVLALLKALLLVLLVVDAVRYLGDVGLVRVGVVRPKPHLELAAGLRVAPVDGLVHELHGALAAANLVFLHGVAEEPLCNALFALHAVRLRLWRVVQELERHRVVAYRVGIFLGEHRLARGVDLAYRLRVVRDAALLFDFDNVREKLGVGVLGRGLRNCLCDRLFGNRLFAGGGSLVGCRGRRRVFRRRNFLRLGRGLGGCRRFHGLVAVLLAFLRKIVEKVQYVVVLLLFLGLLLLGRGNVLCWLLDRLCLGFFRHGGLLLGDGRRRFFLCGLGHGGLLLGGRRLGLLFLIGCLTGLGLCLFIGLRARLLRLRRLTLEILETIVEIVLGENAVRDGNAKCRRYYAHFPEIPHIVRFSCC